MTDISKCPGKECPLKDNCVRYTTPEDSIIQSWIGPAYDPEKKDCWNLLLPYTPRKA